VWWQTSIIPDTGEAVAGGAKIQDQPGKCKETISHKTNKQTVNTEHAAQICNPSIQESEARESQILDQSWLYTKTSQKQVKNFMYST
jgi:hypothetical protein